MTHTDIIDNFKSFVGKTRYLDGRADDIVIINALPKYNEQKERFTIPCADRPSFVIPLKEMGAFSARLKKNIGVDPIPVVNGDPSDQKMQEFVDHTNGTKPEIEKKFGEIIGERLYANGYYQDWVHIAQIDFDGDEYYTVYFRGSGQYQKYKEFTLAELETFISSLKTTPDTPAIVTKINERLLGKVRFIEGKRDEMVVIKECGFSDEAGPWLIFDQGSCFTEFSRLYFKDDDLEKLIASLTEDVKQENDTQENDELDLGPESFAGNNLVKHTQPMLTFGTKGKIYISISSSTLGIKPGDRLRLKIKADNTLYLYFKDNGLEVKSTVRNAMTINARRICAFIKERFKTEENISFYISPTEDLGKEVEGFLLTKK